MKEDKPLIDESQMAAAAVAASSRMLIQGLGVAAGATAATALSAPVALGALIGAAAYYFGRVFLSDENDEKSEEKLIEAINSTKLDVKVDETGNVSTSVKVADEQQSSAPEPFRRIKPVAVKDNNGVTYYYIENLNITVTADIVHQLNINPKEVINMLTEQVKQDSSSISELVKMGRRNEK